MLRVFLQEAKYNHAKEVRLMQEPILLQQAAVRQARQPRELQEPRVQVHRHTLMRRAISRAGCVLIFIPAVQIIRLETPTIAAFLDQAASPAKDALAKYLLHS